MADTSTKWYRSVAEIMQIPAPDDLVQGSYKSDTIALLTSGTYQRGEVLMSSSSGFVKATEEGVASADEVCILADSLTLDDGEAAVSAYFSGSFNPDMVILTYETDTDDHSALIENIKPALRKHNIFIA